MTFKSRYFSEGDELWDLTAELNSMPSKEIVIEQAIFNETTGRLIIRGDDAALDRMNLIADAMTTNIPQMIQLTVKVYQVPMKNWGISRWNGEDLKNSHRSLMEAEMMAQIVKRETE